MHEEKRKHVRLLIPLEVTLSSAKNPETEYNCVAEDLSQEGLHVVLSTSDIKKETPVELTVFNTDKNRSVHVKGTVKWTNSTPETKKTELGIHLTYFDEVEKNRIKDFIREAWLKKTKKIFAEWQEHFDDVYNDLIKNLH